MEIFFVNIFYLNIYMYSVKKIHIVLNKKFKYTYELACGGSVVTANIFLRIFSCSCCC